MKFKLFKKIKWVIVAVLVGILVWVNSTVTKKLWLSSGLEQAGLVSRVRKTSSSQFSGTEPYTDKRANTVALDSTLQYMQEHPQDFPIKEYHQLKGETLESPMGTLVSYKFYQENIPIVGFQIDFRVSRTGKVVLISKSYYPLPKLHLDNKEWLTIDEILQSQDNVYRLGDEKEKLTVSNAIIWVDPVSQWAQLAYVVPVFSLLSKKKVPEQAIFSVTTGQLLAREHSKSEFDRFKKP
ncbi:MAG: hypothetical protein ACKOA8_17020 [Deltaproteobacteria bacterium]